MTDSVTNLARRLRRLEHEVRTSSTQPQLAFSSVEGGGIPVFDTGGTLRQVIGLQPDGAYTVVDFNGTPPPTPSAPVVTSGLLSLSVSWDGLADPATATWPSDFRCVEVHCSTEAAFVPTDSTHVASVYTTKGGQVVIPGLDAGVTYYVVLVAANTSGTESPATAAVSAVPSSAVDQAVLDQIAADVADAQAAASAAQTTADGKNTVYFNLSTDPPVPPTAGFAVGDVWFQPDQGNQRQRWDGAAWLESLDGSETIEADSILAAHIAAGQVSAEHIVAGAIQAEKIAAGAVNTGHLGASAVTAEKIAANAITADKISSGNLSATVALLGTLTVGDPTQGRRLELSPGEGLKVVNQDGVTVVHLPTVPNGLNTFTGDLVAQGFTALGRTQFRGVDNEVSTDSSFILANGVTPPANAPQVEVWLDTAPGGAQAFPVGTNGSSGYFFATDPSRDTPHPAWDAARSRFTWIAAEPTPAGSLTYRHYVYTWDPATGTKTKGLVQGSTNPRIWYAQIPADCVDPDAKRGVTQPVDERHSIHGGAIVGDYMYVLIARELLDAATQDAFFPSYHGHWYVYRINLTNGAMDGNWSWRVPDLDAPTWTEGGGSYGTGDWSSRHLPNLFSSADGNLWVAQTNASGYPVLKKKNPVDGTHLATITGTVAAPSIGDRVATGVHATLDVGERIAIRVGESRTVHHLNPATGIEAASERWESSASYQIPNSPIMWDGTRFYSVGGYNYGTDIVAHATTRTVTATHWAYTWYDPDPAGGTHETPISPLTTFVPKPRWGIRASVNVTPPAAPGNPDSPSEWRMYATTAAATPLATDLHLQARTLDATAWGGSAYRSRTDGTGRPATATAAPPTVNSFPDGNSATIESAVGGFIVRGDGTGEWPFLLDPVNSSLTSLNSSLTSLDSRVDNLEAVASAAGAFDVSAPAASGYVDISFPVGRFDAPPAVTTTCTPTANVALVANVYNVTATGFRAYFYGVGGTWTSGGTTVYWTAREIG